MENIVLMTCSIWTARNNVIFKQEPSSAEIAKRVFKHEFALVIHRAKEEVSFLLVVFPQR